MASPVSSPSKHNVLGGGQRQAEQSLQTHFFQNDQISCQNYMQNHSQGVLTIQIHNMSSAIQNVCESQLWTRDFKYNEVLLQAASSKAIWLLSVSLVNKLLTNIVISIWFCFFSIWVCFSEVGRLFQHQAGIREYLISLLGGTCCQDESSLERQPTSCSTHAWLSFSLEPGSLVAEVTPKFKQVCRKGMAWLCTSDGRESLIPSRQPCVASLPATPCSAIGGHSLHSRS